VKRVLFILFFWPAVLFGQHYQSCPVERHFQDVYENPLYDRYLSKYDVKFYHISLEVSNLNTYITGFTEVLIEALDEVDTIAFQLLDDLTISTLEIDGNQQNNYIHIEDVLLIPLDISTDENASIRIYYAGDAGQDRGFFAGITSAYDNSNDQYVTYTLSEPFNARDWFPVKQVLSDKADSVWVDIICDKNLMGGSIGLLEEIEDLPDNKHKFKWRSNYPIAYYLISMAVADYRDYSFYAPLSDENDSVLVQNFIYDDDDYFAAWESRIYRTKDMITLFSDLVIDYPFANEKYGHCVAPMGGGMEHQTMTTLSNFNFNLVSHELAHQWFGDNVSCGSWQDIWINEGFASYFEYIALNNLYGTENAESWMENAMNLAYTQPEGSVYVPLEDVENVFRVFNYSLTYKKGAVLLHMIRYMLGNDEVFFKILSTFSEKYSDNVATAIEFREVLDSISGMDFSCFFDQWYYGQGYPTFYLSWYTKNDSLYIQSLQEPSSEVTPLFEIPFDIEIETVEGLELHKFYQEEQEQLFSIPISSNVRNIRFDPNKKLLAKSTVVSQKALLNRIVVGPNPVAESMVLRFLQSSDFDHISLYNLKGKLVKTEAISTNPHTLELKSLPNGTYLLVVNGQEGAYMEKILKINTP
jgi:aminopeptidase N